MNFEKKNLCLLKKKYLNYWENQKLGVENYIMKHEFCYFEIQTKIIVTVIIRAFKYPCVLKFIGLRKFKWIRLRGFV